MALLNRYQRAGSYADCFQVDIPGVVAHSAYVAAFYTTTLFKLERFVLKWAVGKASSDSDAQQLAAGTLEHFAAWRVELRAEDQLLLCDVYGRTRSWLMVVGFNSDAGVTTRLYFGSAVVPKSAGTGGKTSMGWGFRPLLGFHRLYSRLLLRAARSRLLKMRPRSD